MRDMRSKRLSFSEKALKLFWRNKNFQIIFALQYNAGVAQLVERQPSKLNVAGSNPVSRSKPHRKMGLFLCGRAGEKPVPSEVEGNPVSRSKPHRKMGLFLCGRAGEKPVPGPSSSSG